MGDMTAQLGETQLTKSEETAYGCYFGGGSSSRQWRCSTRWTFYFGELLMMPLSFYRPKRMPLLILIFLGSILVKEPGRKKRVIWLFFFKPETWKSKGSRGWAWYGWIRPNFTWIPYLVVNLRPEQAALIFLLQPVRAPGMPGRGLCWESGYPCRSRATVSRGYFLKSVLLA
jgi:hypothetical protein